MSCPRLVSCPALLGAFLGALVLLPGCCCCTPITPGNVRMRPSRFRLPAPALSPPPVTVPSFDPAPSPAPPASNAPPYVAPPIAAPPLPPPVAAPPATAAASPRADLRLWVDFPERGSPTFTFANDGTVAHAIVLPSGGSVEGRREPHLYWHVYVEHADGRSELCGEHPNGALRDRVDWVWQDDVVTVQPGARLELPAVLPTGDYEITARDRLRVELGYWYGFVGTAQSGRADRGELEGVEPFVLHAAPVTLDGGRWRAAIQRYREAPRSREPATFRVRAPVCVEVLLDGRSRGTTPLDLTLAPGNYTRAMRLCGGSRGRIGPLVLGPGDRETEELSADDVASLRD